jgi:hypothetical protein
MGGERLLQDALLAIKGARSYFFLPCHCSSFPYHFYNIPSEHCGQYADRTKQQTACIELFEELGTTRGLRAGESPVLL